MFCESAHQRAFLTSCLRWCSQSSRASQLLAHRCFDMQHSAMVPGSLKVLGVSPSTPHQYLCRLKSSRASLPRHAPRPGPPHCGIPAGASPPHSGYMCRVDTLAASASRGAWKRHEMLRHHLASASACRPCPASSRPASPSRACPCPCRASWASCRAALACRRAAWACGRARPAACLAAGSVRLPCLSQAHCCRCRAARRRRAPQRAQARPVHSTPVKALPNNACTQQLQMLDMIRYDTIL